MTIIIDPRLKALDLLARQFALSHQLNWERLNPKRKAQMQTYASTALATIERLQQDYRWEPSKKEIPFA